VAFERSRIARDMHDDLGSSLTQLSLLSDVPASNGQPAQAYAAKLRSVGSATRSILRSLDEIIWTTNPRHDTVESLVSYMGKHATDFFRGSSIACRLDLPIELPPVPLSAQMRHDLLLVVKEVLTNVDKHSQATHVLLKARWEKPKLEIIVRDNGKGIPPVNQMSDPGADGLINMKQRIQSLGGVFF